MPNNGLSMNVAFLVVDDFYMILSLRSVVYPVDKNNHQPLCMVIYTSPGNYLYYLISYVFLSIFVVYGELSELLIISQSCLNMFIPDYIGYLSYIYSM